MKTPTEVVILVIAMLIAIVIEIGIVLGFTASLLSVALQGPTAWNVAGATVFGFLLVSIVLAMVRR